MRRHKKDSVNTGQLFVLVIGQYFVLTIPPYRRKGEGGGEGCRRQHNEAVVLLLYRQSPTEVGSVHNVARRLCT